MRNHPNLEGRPLALGARPRFAHLVGRLLTAGRRPAARPALVVPEGITGNLLIAGPGGCGKYELAAALLKSWRARPEEATRLAIVDGSGLIAPVAARFSEFLGEPVAEARGDETARLAGFLAGGRGVLLVRAWTEEERRPRPAAPCHHPALAAVAEEVARARAAAATVVFDDPYSFGSDAELLAPLLDAGTEGLRLVLIAREARAVPAAVVERLDRRIEMESRTRWRLYDREGRAVTEAGRRAA